MQQQEKFDWIKPIRLNIQKLRFVGFWPENIKKLSLYNVWTVISFIFIITAHNFFQAVNIYFVLDNLKAVTSTIFLNLSELLGILKAYYLVKNINIVKDLLIVLSSDDFQPKTKKQQNLIQPNLKFWKQIYVIYWTMGFGAVFFWAVFPILDDSVKDHRLPFMAWYPFDTTVSPYYEIVYVYQIVGIAFVAISTMGADTLIAALAMCIGAQIDILSDDLKKIRAENFSEELLKCIQHHKKILRFSKKTNEFLNWIVFFQFFISATSIGITMFQMTVVVPFTSEFFSLLSFELAIVVEIFMYCWFGNEIEEKSKLIPLSIFESDWVNATKEAKKTMSVFVAITQRPIKISALNLFYLSLQTFLKIMQTSWSYFTLLHNIQQHQSHTNI